MNLRAEQFRRVLALFVCGVFCYVIFYNSLFLDRQRVVQLISGRLRYLSLGNNRSQSTENSVRRLPQPKSDPGIWLGGRQPTAVKSGQAAVQSGQAAVQSGQATVQSGQVAVQSGQAAVQSGQATVQSGQATVQSGHVTVQSGQVAEHTASKEAAQPSQKTGAGQLPTAGSHEQQQHPAEAPLNPAAKTAAAAPPKSPPPPLGTPIKSLYEPGFRVASAERCPERGRHLTVVILITSAPTHERQRKAIRLTWGAVSQRRDVALVFFLGSASEDVQRRLDAERETYGDIVQGNFIDAYRNLSLKSVSMLEWLDTVCPEARMILKTDDDMFINTDNLLAFVRAHAKESNSFYGKLARRWKPIRNSKSKYYLSPQLYPGKYLPDFMTGPAYVMTGDLTHKLYVGALQAPFIPLEDVLVTGVVGEALHVRRVHAREFINDRVKVDTCKLMTSISVHMVKFEEQFDIWKRVQDGRSHCPRAYLPTGG